MLIDISLISDLLLLFNEQVSEPPVKTEGSVNYIINWVLGAISVMVSTLYVTTIKSFNGRLADKDKSLTDIVGEKDKAMAVLSQSHKNEVQNYIDLNAKLQRDIERLDKDNIKVMSDLKFHMVATTTALEKMLDIVEKLRIHGTFKGAD